MGRESDPPGPPSRNFGYNLKWLRTSPGARKEKIRQGLMDLLSVEPEAEFSVVPLAERLGLGLSTKSGGPGKGFRPKTP